MPIRCLIVDDESPARSRLRRMLKPYTDIEIIDEATDADEACSKLDELKPDLCFLDVQMPAGTGFDVLQRADHRPQVVFVTAFDHYAVEAFDVHSVDYLLKPFSKQRLAEALERVRARFVKPADETAAALDRVLEVVRERVSGSTEGAMPERLSARKGSKIVLLDPKEIFWFEAEDTLIFAWSVQGRCLVEKTLSELEEQLSERFFRAHRQILVNLSAIHEILPGDAGTYQIRIRGVKEPLLPLSRRQARKLREIFPW
jgi:DNA-binding LytR/AlgR family response regulator